MAEHLESLSNDFGGVSVDTLFIRPLPGLESAFYVNGFTLLDVLLDDLSELPIGNNTMPLCIFLLLALFVLPSVRGGKT
jgi:hypothetical protein